MMKSAASGFFPTVDLSAGWMRERESRMTGKIPLPNNEYDSYYSGLITASWEIDVFGSIRKNYSYRKNLYQASRDEYYATMVSLTSTLAQAYVNLRINQNQVSVIESNIISQGEILKITQARYNAGLNSELDVAQAKALFYSTKSSLSSYLAAQTKYICTIALLVGEIPQNIKPYLLASAKIPQINSLVPTSIPANIIRQRPDLLAAEKNVQAQADYLGIQKKQWLPTFFIDGEIGLASHDLNKMFESRSMVWQVAPTMKWTVFNGGARTAAISEAKAELQTSIIKYNYSVQNAIQEVDVAISDYSNYMMEFSDIKTATSAAERSLTLSLDLYKNGLADYLNVLDSQKTLLSYQLSLYSTQGDLLNSLISLYTSLGGGWPLKDAN